MASTLPMTLSNEFYLKNICNLIQIPLKLATEDIIDNKRSEDEVVDGNTRQTITLTND